MLSYKDSNFYYIFVLKFTSHEMMKKENIILLGLSVMSAVMMSVPFLVPHTGFLSLLGLIPLLCMDRIATIQEKRHVWIFHYTTFVLWNAITTFWVCNATVGGGLFAIFANAFQMSLIFGLFRLSKKKFSGALPYIFLMVTWIAWERFYFDAEISWPWLVLGNSFAQSIGSIQWYEYTGTLGGSLWIWACNLGVFGLLVSLSDGKWFTFNWKAKTAALTGLVAAFTIPFIASSIIEDRYDDCMTADEQLEVLIIQPNIDPYNKFQAMTQADQNALLLNAAEKNLAYRKNDTTAAPLLILAPETFTNDIVTNNIKASRSWQTFASFLQEYPQTSMLFGASSRTYIETTQKPSHTARNAGDGFWRESHNSALMVNGNGRTDIFHKNKLVVAVEKTPYPALFCPIDDKLGGVMGRCIGQGDVTLLNMYPSMSQSIPLGCAVCYESVYGEYYTQYIRQGAKAMTIITNDAWWGDTPGYRQHLSYASLRAIETRRAIARCANTGISAIISPSGEILQPTPWWEPAVIKSQIPLRDDITFFVRNGDITGRICSFIFILLLLALGVKLVTKERD